jgi:hypothetical protein
MSISFRIGCHWRGASDVHRWTIDLAEFRRFALEVPSLILPCSGVVDSFMTMHPAAEWKTVWPDGWQPEDPFLNASRFRGASYSSRLHFDTTRTPLAGDEP